jgi:predicted PurR-regulated permease PerM
VKNFRWDKKYLYWGITAFCVIVTCIIFFWILQGWPTLWALLSKIMVILSPFVWGLVISYLLAPMTRWFQNKLFEPLGKRIFKSDARRLFGFSRALAILLAILVALALVTGLLWLILPQLYTSIESIALNMSTYVSHMEAWIQRLFEDYPVAEEYVVAVLGDLSDGLSGWIKNSLLPVMNSIVTSAYTSVIFVVKGVYNIFVGLVVSCYVLFNKETFGAHVKKILYSTFSQRGVERFLHALDFTDRAVMGFVSGKILDSLIIGLLCYICCSLLRMPDVILISVIVGVTNIIPFFGPFIGAVPCALIILMMSTPMKCLIFIIFIILLQQLDGNIIGPKILGSTVGINGFWIMFSIILGAGLFGFLGMLLGVPVFSVIYAGIRCLVNGRLKKRGLPVETAQYKNVDHVEPVASPPQDGGDA